MKATAIAPSNLAFIKYWGRKNGDLRLPTNASISMNLSSLLTTTTVEFTSSLEQDEFELNETKYDYDSKKVQRVVKHLDRIRKLGQIKSRARVVSSNNFPSDTGLSSSSSGLAALTVAAATAANLNLSEKELSILARKGSGSACRSIPNGFVEWLDGDSDQTSFAVSLFPPSHWEIADVVAIISNEQKEVGSTEGQESANTSPFYETRLAKIDNKIKKAKSLLEKRQFSEFGEMVEAEALELHAIMITSSPSLIYWQPETVKMMKLVKKWRSEGLQVYFSLNTGQDMHIICEKKNIAQLTANLGSVPEVKEFIVNYPSNGTSITNEHLF